MAGARAFWVAVLAVAALVVLAALVALRPWEREEGVTITVVTRLAPEEGLALKRVFLDSGYAGEAGVVDVNFVKEDVSKWPVLAESGEADLFFVGGFAIFKDLCDRGYFAPIEDEEVLGVIEELGALAYRGPGGSVCFAAVSTTVFSFTINNDFLARHGLPKPGSWEDLASPEYSKPVVYNEYPVSFPRPSKSSTAARTVQLILQKYGWEEGWSLLTVIGANSYIVESSERARDDVALGITGAAPTVLVYGLRAVNASGGSAEVVAAEGGVLPDISPVAIAKGSRNPEAALAFIKWLYSPEGQLALAQLFFYLPYRDVEVPGLEDLYRDLRANLFPYDPAEAAMWERAAVYYFEAAIADPDSNALLKRLWARILALYDGGEITAGDVRRLAAEMGRPLSIEMPEGRVVFTKEYAESINEAIASDPGFRAEFMRAVKEAAISRYESMLASLGG